MVLVFILISISYFLLITAFIIGFGKVETVKNENFEPKNTFSIIIPFRNEVKNLPELLNSLSLLNYPKNLFEILLINDESSDGFNSIIQSFIQNNSNLKIHLIEKKRLNSFILQMCQPPYRGQPPCPSPLTILPHSRPRTGSSHKCR